ncbi:MAG: hypothetical protein KGH59_03815 [Candidatus Micrarchaeota archaeon]|nr:hypothetical protein [Candidatus Micrarchaeota archaeon]MDE1804880.1 hypothetical protein [Candidatus Micrarchaeota archaeon]MDE1847158.1 hypothetical protein [Candidatus Micrarchaeota archaeon]
MARTRTNLSLENEGDRQRCRVLIEGIQNGRREMALEFHQIYTDVQKQEILDKYVPKREHQTFMEFVKMWSEIELSKARRH